MGGGWENPLPLPARMGFVSMLLLLLEGRFGGRARGMRRRLRGLGGFAGGARRLSGVGFFLVRSSGWLVVWLWVVGCGLWVVDWELRVGRKGYGSRRDSFRSLDVTDGNGLGWSGLLLGTR